MVLMSEINEQLQLVKLGEIRTTKKKLDIKYSHIVFWIDTKKKIPSKSVFFNTLFLLPELTEGVWKKFMTSDVRICMGSE